LKDNELCGAVEVEIYYERAKNSFVLKNKFDESKCHGSNPSNTRNLPIDESCHKVFRRLYEGETCPILPSDVIKIGTLLLLVQRFNTGIVGDCGYRSLMEDMSTPIQDLKISNYVFCSFFGVYDG
jgi:hypothetical protein